MGAKELLLRKTLATLCLIGGTVLGNTLAEGAPAPPQKYVYTVHHSRYGSIGTYTNTVMREGDDVSVNTDIRIVVSFFGMALFRQDASRQEHWASGRLVSFHGVTTTNGHPIEVNGAA